MKLRLFLRSTDTTFYVAGLPGMSSWEEANEAWRQLQEQIRIKKNKASGYTGDIDATHRWNLPGVLGCPACKATWGDNSRAYPSVDLTPVEALADFEEARAEPIEKYERLCERVRPILPPGALLQPGAAFGPLVGKAQGRFGPLSLQRSPC